MREVVGTVVVACVIGVSGSQVGKGRPSGGREKETG